MTALSRRLRTLFPAVLVPLVTAQAQPPEVLSLDSSQSSLSFHAQNTFDSFDGKVAQMSGTVTLSQGRPGHGTVKFPAAALKTGVEGRDHSMDEPRFLDVSHFADVSFDLDALDGPAVPEGHASGTLHGKLHVKAVTLPIEVPVTYGRSNGALHVDGAFPLDIRGLGMEPPVVAVVQRMDPVIHISFRLVFRVQQ
jgi:polyisoprenoid-binding protein YceI